MLPGAQGQCTLYWHLDSSVAIYAPGNEFRYICFVPSPSPPCLGISPLKTSHRAPLVATSPQASTQTVPQILASLLLCNPLPISRRPMTSILALIIALHHPLPLSASTIPLSVHDLPLPLFSYDPPSLFIWPSLSQYMTLPYLSFHDLQSLFIHFLSLALWSL